MVVFFDQSDVPPTNNVSEQDLRPSAIHRKVTGGYRSQLGADIAAILTSQSIAGPSPLHLAAP